jgi:hypothetical protein
MSYPLASGESLSLSLSLSLSCLLCGPTSIVSLYMESRMFLATTTTGASIPCLDTSHRPFRASLTHLAFLSTHLLPSPAMRLHNLSLLLQFAKQSHAFIRTLLLPPFQVIQTACVSVPTHWFLVSPCLTSHNVLLNSCDALHPLSYVRFHGIHKP